MRDCEFVHAHLYDWLDECLDDADLSRFDAHIAACDACATRIGRERRIMRELAALNTIGNRIAHEGVGAAPATPPRSWRAWRIAATIALLIGGGYAIRGWRASIGPQSPNANPSAVANRIDEPAQAFTTFSLPQDDTRLSVRIPSDDAQIHIFWLYETEAPAIQPKPDPMNDEGPADGNAPSPNRS